MFFPAARYITLQGHSSEHWDSSKGPHAPSCITRMCTSQRGPGPSVFTAGWGCLGCQGQLLHEEGGRCASKHSCCS